MKFTLDNANLDVMYMKPIYLFITVPRLMYCPEISVIIIKL